MIRIRRPTIVPQVLDREGRRRRDEHIVLHSTGSSSIDFDRAVYGHADVKAALRGAQHDKCAFCESKISHIASGDVEHFRPKAAFRSTSNDPIVRPGYFWLAYEWANLLFSCERCNRRHKVNLFPLRDEASRARTPSDDISRESPMFIDPSGEDPRLHIEFREEVPYAIGGNRRGEVTIEALGLRRAELMERRRDRLQKIRQLRSAVNLLKRSRRPSAKALAREISAELDLSAEDGAEYASMIRSDPAAAP